MGRISTLKKCAQDDFKRLHRLSDSCLSILNSVCWGFVRLYMITFISPTLSWQELLLRNQNITLPMSTHASLFLHQVQNHFDQFVFFRRLACCNHQGESSERVVVDQFAAVFSQKNFVPVQETDKHCRCNALVAVNKTVAVIPGTSMIRNVKRENGDFPLPARMPPVVRLNPFFPSNLFILSNGPT